MIWVVFNNPELAAMAIKPSEIRSLKALLRHSHELVSDALGIAKGASEVDQVRRLKDIALLISDELANSDRRLSNAERGGRP